MEHRIEFVRELDGVRYINLPDLWKADGTVNPNYKMLRFRVKDGAVTYEAVHIK